MLDCVRGLVVVVIVGGGVRGRYAKGVVFEVGMLVATFGLE